MRNKKRIAMPFVLTAVCLVLVVSAGCSAKQAETSVEGGYGYSSSYDYASAPAVAPEAEAAAPAPAAEPMMPVEDQAAMDNGTAMSGGAYVPAPEAQTQKIILNGYVNMEAAQADFDAAMSNLKAEAAAVGGYIESSSLSAYNRLEDGTELRSFSIRLRVPSERYTEAWEAVQTFGKVQNASESQQNVTQQYYDMQGRLDTKKIEEERVLELIDRATDVEDLLALEEMLGRIRLDIEIYETKLTDIDRLAGFSSIDVTLNEVQKITEVRVQANMGDKMKEGFIQSVNGTLNFLQNIVLGIVYISVPLIVIIVLFAFGFGIFKATNRKR